MRIFFLSMFVILSSAMSECTGEALEEILDEIPVMELNGELDVTIGLNEEYVDPGVNILGDLDIEVKTTTDLDVTQYGIYSYLYEAVIDGDRFTLGRRVRVVPDTEKNYHIALAVETENPSSLVFSISIDDEAGSLINGEAVLYSLNAEIGRLPVTHGTNFLEFDELENQTFYRLEFIGSYIDNEVEYSLGEYVITANTTYIDPADYPRLELIGEPEIHLNAGDEYIEEGATIIGDYESDIAIESDLDTSVEGTYQIRYSIVFNKATLYAHRTVIVHPAEAVPFAVEIELLKAEAYSLTFSVTVEDEDGKISMPYGSLYKGDIEVGRFPYADGTTEMKFENLSDNTEYRFVLKGVYQKENSLVGIGDYQLEVTTLEILVINPIYQLVLNGESSIDVAIGSQFIDPGVTMIGYPDAVITQTLFDINTLGTYTITYSTVVDGNPYNVTRTINVIPLEVLDFGVELSLLSVTETTITYSITVNSEYYRLYMPSARLWQGDTYIDSQTFYEGTTVITFTGLEEGTEYKVVLIGDYFINGDSVSFGDYQLSATTLGGEEPALDVPVITLDSYEIGIEYIDVLINVDDPNNQMVSMNAYIYDGAGQQANVSTLVTGTNPIMFDWIKQETNYSLLVEYEYTVSGETVATKVETTLLDFTTLAPPKPVLTSIDCIDLDTSITCSAEWNEEGFAPGISYYAELWSSGQYLGDIYFISEGTSLYVEDLNPGQPYILKIYADYLVIETSAMYTSLITEIDRADLVE